MKSFKDFLDKKESLINEERKDDWDFKSQNIKTDKVANRSIAKDILSSSQKEKNTYKEGIEEFLAKYKNGRVGDISKTPEESRDLFKSIYVVSMEADTVGGEEAKKILKEIGIEKIDGKFANHPLAKEGSKVFKEDQVRYKKEVLNKESEPEEEEEKEEEEEEKPLKKEPIETGEDDEVEDEEETTSSTNKEKETTSSTNKENETTSSTNKENERENKLEKTSQKIDSKLKQPIENARNKKEEFASFITPYIKARGVDPDGSPDSDANMDSLGEKLLDLKRKADNSFNKVIQKMEKQSKNFRNPTSSTYIKGKTQLRLLQNELDKIFDDYKYKTRKLVSPTALQRAGANVKAGTQAFGNKLKTAKESDAGQATGRFLQKAGSGTKRVAGGAYDVAKRVAGDTMEKAKQVSANRRDNKEVEAMKKKSGEDDNKQLELGLQGPTKPTKPKKKLKLNPEDYIDYNDTSGRKKEQKGLRRVS